VKRTRRTCAILAVVTTILALLGSGVAAAQEPYPVLYLNPVMTTVDITELAVVEVWINDVTDFYGVEFELFYDPAVVEALSVVAGDAFTAYPDEYEVVQASVGGGLVEFAASLLATPKAPPLSGDLHLATITFDPVTEGDSALTWIETKVSNSTAEPIGHNTLNGSITVVWMGAVSGNAYMEGRISHDGILVEIANGTTTSGLTSSSGYYYFGSVISGLYDLTMSHDMYLTSELISCTVSGGVTNYLPDVTLLGGDLNGDEVINILDLSFCAAHFNEVYPDADINVDGIVDVFDVVLIGKNFGMVGPVTATCP